MKIAIVDHIRKDTDIIIDYLYTYISKQKIPMTLSIHAFADREELLQAFQQESFDLIFMDFPRQGISGLETAHAIRSLDRNVIIIFTTASRDYVMDGYKARASGYLLKPVSFEAFSETLSFIDIANLQAQHFIEIKTGYKLMKILIDNILYCDISGHYVNIHTINLGIQRSRMTFACLQKQLICYEEFLLCYRGCIINMNHIDRIHDCTFRLDNGENIPFSRNQNSMILKKYSEYLCCRARKQN